MGLEFGTLSVSRSLFEYVGKTLFYGKWKLDQRGNNTCIDVHRVFLCNRRSFDDYEYDGMFIARIKIAMG